MVLPGPGRVFGIVLPRALRGSPNSGGFHRVVGNSHSKAMCCSLRGLWTSPLLEWAKSWFATVDF